MLAAFGMRCWQSLHRRIWPHPVAVFLAPTEKDIP